MTESRNVRASGPDPAGRSASVGDPSGGGDPRQAQHCSPARPAKNITLIDCGACVKRWWAANGPVVRSLTLGRRRRGVQRADRDRGGVPSDARPPSLEWSRVATRTNRTTGRLGPSHFEHSGRRGQADQVLGTVTFRYSNAVGITSPPARVAMALQTEMSTESRTRCTLPSMKSA